MITWLNYWPFLGLPTLLLTAAASLPTQTINGRLWGGGPVREAYLNTFAIPAPVLPADEAARLVEWFSTASAWQEWGLAVAVAININALMLPLLYGFGVLIIEMSAWVTRNNIELKRQAIK